jgi:flagellin
MALKINFNPEATVTHTALLQNERAMNKSLLRISTGQRILSAADDAAGLFIADQLNVVASALEQGNRNVQTGISALQIAEANVGQIFDKLRAIYTKAQSAANDINDPNARLALQRDILNLVDFIQRLGTDTEYNGIKLLDGTFANRVIHYGARADQTVTVGINSVRAQDLGAYMILGRMTTNFSTTAGYLTGASATNTNFRFDTNDRAIVAGINVATGLDVVDAKTIANNINSNTTLQNLGITAKAVNVSTARDAWTNIAPGTGQTATIRFFYGPSTTAAFFTTVGANQVLTLQDMVTYINTQASARSLNLTARAQDGRLVLETQGETIGIEVTVSANVTVNLGQFMNVSGTVSATGSAIQVGKLTISGPESYSYDFTNISNTRQGLGIVPPTGDATMNNLYSLNVLTNENAELALDIVNTALRRVDTIRTQIGSVINNLQAIWDGQKAAYDNTKEAESIIRNTDFAEEMSTFTTMQIRMQAGMAMLAQANALPQLVLQLLR